MLPVVRVVRVLLVLPVVWVLRVVPVLLAVRVLRCPCQGDGPGPHGVRTRAR